MAYLDFAQPLAGAPFAASAAVAPAFHASRPELPDPERASLSALEWKVVELASTDPLSSLRAPGRWDRLGAFLFGAQPSRTLGNERLEALRRLSIEAWHNGYAVTPSALAEARRTGFTSDQLELLFATISAGRDARGRKARP